jgi:hypothetical protein
MILAKLEDVAPPIKIANRAIKSLSEIFCTWHRNTAASLDERLAVIDRLARKHASVAWELLLTMLPKSYDVSGNIAQPRWRARPEVPPVTYGEIWRANDEHIQRVLNAAGSDGAKLAELFSEIASWRPEQRQRLVEQIDSFGQTCTDAEQRAHLWNKLREFVSRHHAYPDAKWALPEADLLPFDRLVKDIEPRDSWESSVWLFDRDLPEFLNSQAESVGKSEERTKKKRQEVVNDLYGKVKLDGLCQFARRVKMPWLVGATVAESISDPELDEQILTGALATSEDAIRKFALAFVLRRREIQGSKWSDAVLASPSFAAWPAAKKAEFCLCLPEGPSSWQVTADLGIDVEREYWHRAIVFISRHTDAEAQIAIQKLLQFDRSILALEQCGYHPEKLSTGTLVKVLEAALAELARTHDFSAGAMLQYYLERVFGKLRESDIAEIDLARLEWQYLPLLRWNSTPVTLHRFLEKDPAFFATVLSYAYKADDREIEGDSGDQESEDTDSDEDETFSPSADERRNRARLAWDLLDTWHTPPGVCDGRLNAAELREWITKARAICAKQRRARIGDDRIGHLLARVPAEADGVWPPSAVRDLIDEIASRELEEGLHAGRINSRGVYSKNPLDGGRSERALAKQYRTWAKAARASPRTARLLTALADTYDRFGRVEDFSAERLDID